MFQTQTGYHVLDEVPVAGSVDDGHYELFSFKLPQGNVNGDASLPFSLQLVQHPRVLE